MMMNLEAIEQEDTEDMDMSSQSTGGVPVIYIWNF